MVWVGNKRQWPGLSKGDRRGKVTFKLCIGNRFHCNYGYEEKVEGPKDDAQVKHINNIETSYH